MTRRDRAAMVLALECLRVHRWDPSDKRHEERLLDEARRVLAAGGDVSQAPADACPTRYDWFDYTYPPRLLRARLALALRVLLRVDAGDYGPRWWHCSAECGAGYLGRRLPPAGERHRCGEYESGVVVHSDYEPVRPLWEAAPQHDPAVTPAMRRQR